MTGPRSRRVGIFAPYEDPLLGLTLAVGSRPGGNGFTNRVGGSALDISEGLGDSIQESESNSGNRGVPAGALLGFELGCKLGSTLGIRLGDPLG